MYIDPIQARQIAAQLASGILSREEFVLVDGKVEKNAELAVELFTAILNKLSPPQPARSEVKPLRV